MENLAFGLQLTLAGMSLVFGVLVLLWGVLTLIGRLDREPAPHAQPVESLDAALLAAVTIAVAMHVTSRRRQAAPEMRSTVPGSQIYASRWLAAGRTRQTRAWLKRH